MMSAPLWRKAGDENWVRPHLFDDKRFLISGGRHPVVEAALRHDGVARLSPIRAPLMQKLMRRRA